MNIREIQDLIKFVSKAGVSEVSLETEEFKLTVKTESPAGKAKETVIYQTVPETQTIVQTQAPAPVSQPSVAAAPAPGNQSHSGNKSETNANQVTIKSPMIGTFYRSAGPDKPAFVSVGDEVAPGKVICIIEAMKLFNDIECDVKGRIVKVLVDDASPVEYDQPLFIVENI